MPLHDQKALVTGASKGIGFATARDLVAAGVAVVLSGRNQDELDRLAGELTAVGPGTALGMAADLTDHAACTRLVTEAADAMGGLDILINNAGLGVFKSIEELTWEEWREQVDLNLGAVWSCTKAALPHLKASDNGWVINVGSLASRNAFAGGTGYNASKFGLLGMTEATMQDLRGHGIRVSIVMPGSVNTDFGSSPREPNRGWKLEADDCAQAVLHLLAYPKGAHVSRIEMRPAVKRQS